MLIRVDVINRALVSLNLTNQGIRFEEMNNMEREMLGHFEVVIVIGSQIYRAGPLLTQRAELGRQYINRDH